MKKEQSLSAVLSSVHRRRCKLVVGSTQLPTVVEENDDDDDDDDDDYNKTNYDRFVLYQSGQVLPRRFKFIERRIRFCHEIF